MGELKELIKTTLVKASSLSCVTTYSEISDLRVASADAGAHLLGICFITLLKHLCPPGLSLMFNTEHIHLVLIPSAGALRALCDTPLPGTGEARASRRPYLLSLRVPIADNSSDKPAPSCVTDWHRPEHPPPAAPWANRCPGLRQPGMNPGGQSPDLQQPRGGTSAPGPAATPPQAAAPAGRERHGRSGAAHRLRPTIGKGGGRMDLRSL